MYLPIDTSFIEGINHAVKTVSSQRFLSIITLSYFIFVIFVSYLTRKLFLVRKELRKTKEKLRAYSFVDNLTGAYNYRYFIKRLKESIGYAQRKNIYVSLLKLDIDLFKNINTIYGMAFGDTILKAFASFLMDLTRGFDIVARLGDDEFGVLLNFTNKEEALALANRLQNKLQSKNFGRKNNRVNIYVSSAVVTFPCDGYSIVDLLSLLDRCLEKSKENCKRIVTPDDLEREEKDKFNITVYTPHYFKKNIHTLNKNTLDRTVIESIIAFAHAIKAKDLYTAEHTARTVRISLSLGRKVELDSYRMDIVRYAALLHDLGKVGIPERILLKPDKLTPEEFEEIKKHPVIGVEILRPLHGLKEIIPPILYHHERIDGCGYPVGLMEDSIPLEAKIVAIADTFQALISDRVYRKAYTIDEAIDIMDKESGTHFDRHLIKIFKEIVLKGNY